MCFTPMASTAFAVVSAAPSVKVASHAKCIREHKSLLVGERSKYFAYYTVLLK